MAADLIEFKIKESVIDGIPQDYPFPDIRYIHPVFTQCLKAFIPAYNCDILMYPLSAYLSYF